MTKKDKLLPRVSPYRFAGSLALLSLVSIVLLISRMSSSGSSRFGFLYWNLFLALIPLLLAVWLVQRIRLHGWRPWQQLALAGAWLAFLPNSFYMMTDMVHLQANYEADLLFDIVMLTSFMLSGMALGYTGLFLVHTELTKRLSEVRAYGLIAIILLAASFAICLGRYTRWNTWDILLRPAGLLFDVSDRLLYPANYWQTYETTVTLFLVLFAGYAALWEAARLIRGREQ